MKTNNKVYVDLIFSYDVYNQDLFSNEIFDFAELESAQDFINHLFASDLIDDEKQSALRKISMCVYGVLDNIPSWIIEDNGKIYLLNREII